MSYGIDAGWERNYFFTFYHNYEFDEAQTQYRLVGRKGTNSRLSTHIVVALYDNVHVRENPRLPEC